MLAAAKKLLLLITVLFASDALAQSRPWWEPYRGHRGFEDALSVYGLNSADLDADPEQAVDWSGDTAHPLHWLHRTLRIYGQAHAGAYRIPVTERAEDERARTTSNPRSGRFLTEVYMQPGETAQIRLPASLPRTIACYASLTSNFDEAASIADTRMLGPGTTWYTATRQGMLLIDCRDGSKRMAHSGEEVPVEIGTGSLRHDAFVFGLTPFEEWPSIARRPNPLGQVFMFNGRTRFYVPKEKAAAAAGIDIGRLMREHLAMTLAYDRLNGLDGHATDRLHWPSAGLITASYEGCCSATSSEGFVRIGFRGYPASATDWGDWHEYGHQYQMGWSWRNALTEVSVNLYSIAACHSIHGERDACHPNSHVRRLGWSREAVGAYLQSGKQSNFDQMAGGTEFERFTLFGQLWLSHPDLFRRLGRAYREAYARGQGASLFDTVAKKKDWFVRETSRGAGRDLRPYYQRWGLGFSTDTHRQVAELRLPAPVLPAFAARHALASAGGPAQAGGTAVNTWLKWVGFVTYGQSEGDSALAWYSRDAESILFVDARSSSGVKQQVVLIGQRTQGGCAKPLHVTHLCYGQPGRFAYSVRYEPALNGHLPPGRYQGTLRLAARDHIERWWGGEVTMDLDIRVPSRPTP
ncbi:M60 family metallopeptidase [Pseudoxanthomonas sp.]|jgi:hypothetical protein|uniref:M60 family metallopeptidase n=1 Tax=Pseudoxanthomonas sp. TaxID=1871049 RepID=UPI002E0DE554|nr:M60 family metallopeptidase [Pseudoxanthomonas sp.]